jgi:hypothetical protein
MREKIECDIKLVIVSSDSCDYDYQVLLDKLKSNQNANDRKQEQDEEEHKEHPINEKETKKQKYPIARLSLDFESKSIKEQLFKQLNVLSIPWFSLINAGNGDILCKDLKLFILHEELKQIVF